jgi:hypothetical protein
MGNGQPLPVLGMKKQFQNEIAGNPAGERTQ